MSARTLRRQLKMLQAELADLQAGNAATSLLTKKQLNGSEPVRWNELKIKAVQELISKIHPLYRPELGLLKLNQLNEQEMSRWNKLTGKKVHTTEELQELEELICRCHPRWDDVQKSMHLCFAILWAKSELNDSEMKSLDEAGWVVRPDWKYIRHYRFRPSAERKRAQPADEAMAQHYEVEWAAEHKAKADELTAKKQRFESLRSQDHLTIAEMEEFDVLGGQLVANWTAYRWIRFRDKDDLQNPYPIDAITARYYETVYGESKQEISEAELNKLQAHAAAECEQRKRDKGRQRAMWRIEKDWSAIINKTSFPGGGGE